ncbi:Uncharacterized protein HZ326_24098 [Fusarium oxysporum f. sp. albedinis]|nr:Uncharacterized protein HZ326_24098 [Fusarium oxysporum f. sp. albedinis]
MGKPVDSISCIPPTERSFQLRSEDQLELLERHKRTWIPYSKTCSHGRAASDDHQMGDQGLPRSMPHYLQMNSPHWQ